MNNKLIGNFSESEKEKHYFMGLDIGSTTSKCLIIDESKQIISHAIVNSGTGTSGPKRVVEIALSNAKLSVHDIVFTVATGYGRNNAALAEKTMSELSCHARGAYCLFPSVRTVIDIGGQDAKALSINESGLLQEFVMNDKCAAGTGRFLDVMSRVLELNISEMSSEALKSNSPAKISSTCTVFAESEVVSQLSNNTPICDIAAGIGLSVSSRVSALVKRLGVKSEVVMTGGVASNEYIRQCLERELGLPIKTSPLAQLAGALGAALYASEL